MRTRWSTRAAAIALTLACGGAADRIAPPPCDTEGFCADAAAPSGGGTRWIRQLGTAGANEQVVAVATRSDGVSVALARSYGPREQSTLTWLGSDGAVLATRTYPGAVGTFYAAVGFGPGGDVYLWVHPMSDIFIAPRTSYPDFGGGPISGATVARLSGTGDLRWQRLISEDAEPDQYASRFFPDSMSVDGAGNVAISTRGSFHSTVHRCNADGTLAWSRVFAAFTNVAFAPDGSLYVAENGYSRSDSIPMRTRDSFGAIWKLDASGAVVWQAAFEGGDAWGSVVFDALGTTALGTVAASGTASNASIAFAGTTLAASPPRSFLAALEPDGTPRFLRDTGRPAARGAENAVHPDGSVAIVVDDLGGCGFDVQLWGLDGKRRWARSFTAETCDSYTAPLWRRLAYGAAIAPDGTVLVGGLLRLPMDFGLGVFESRGGEQGLFGGGEDGFVLALAP